MNPTEQTGEKFQLQTYLKARELCRSVVERIASQVQVGMNEQAGQELIKSEFLKAGVSKFWHPSKFRVGPETMKTFRALPDQEIRLAAGDLFFLDVGPIIDEHEADLGETFLLPDPNSQNSKCVELSQAAQAVWQETSHRWQNESLSGEALYKFAEARAEARGFKLNPLMAGHRLGDFPHALYSKEKLSTLNLTPSNHLWVLEIHVIDESLQRGAFFEDILMKITKI